MSQRPPGTYWERHTTISTTVATPRSSAGSGLHLRGIIFEAGGNFVSTPSDVPTGSSPASTTIVVTAGFYELVPASIDPTTTALPFTLVYGPLGTGGR